ncbi:DUF2637 domain-containing protein [Streptomyces flaveus]|uniref:DUF2637 domain-containing protein n=1 Tax=Streptomyces flaveus TaxID=66370 RepID=A0A917VV33_9ACTN|nr:DUF2637 domain-containing protein [Streptomyces flaveus]GGL17008.1 hypothetical protein GCM10010094_92340 [Streptomyces flaveus]
MEAWVRRTGALAVAGVAAYASYVHQREFALQGGADRASATLWPLSVDGLLLLATAGVLKQPAARDRRTRYVVRLAFLLGIGVSLAANVAAAPAIVLERKRPSTVDEVTEEAEAEIPRGHGKEHVGAVRDEDGRGQESAPDEDKTP